MSPQKLSYTMETKLAKILDRGGSYRFASGFPTFEALERRGLIKILPPEGGSILWWKAEITEAGRKALENLKSG